MNTPQKKIIQLIDQLFEWKNDYPTTALPSDAIEKFKILYDKIINTKILTPAELEDLKPKLIQTKYVPVPIKKKTIASSVKKPSRKTSTYYKQLIQEYEKIKSLPEEPKEEVYERTIINGKDMVLCPRCNSPLLERNISKHKSKCSFNRKKKYQKRITIVNNSSNKQVPQTRINDYSTERKLDGSAGYHIFRENGRFGSYPSFDNMNDESHP